MNAERYRTQAALLDAKATTEQSPATQAEYRSLAAAYRRLAEQAKRNALLDLTYETPERRPQIQQQQQAQLRERDEA